MLKGKSLLLKQWDSFAPIFQRSLYQILKIKPSQSHIFPFTLFVMNFERIKCYSIQLNGLKLVLL
jgi:hypothetical protein